MKKLSIILTLLSLTLIPPGYAQDESEEIFELNPFTISAVEDDGYQATNTLSGTRIKTSLRDIGTSIQVITTEFLEDTGITKVTELLQYTTSTEVSGGAGGNFSNPGNRTPAFFSSSAETRQAQPSTRIRGLSAASTARNLYASIIPFDSYNLNRVEVNRGANSILFGLGSPAGIINYTTTEAKWANEHMVEARVDSHGSVRGVLDLNRVLIDDMLAVRVIILSDSTEYKQEPSFRDDQRVYGAVTFRPYKNTTLSLSYENGTIDSSLPRQDPPIDYFTHFFPTNGINHTIPVNEDYRDKAPALNGLATVQHDSGANGTLRIVGEVTSSGSNEAFVQYPETYFKGGVLNPMATNPARANDFRYRRVAMQNSREYLAQVFGNPLGPQAYLLNLVDPTVFDFFNNTIDGTASSQYGEIEAFNAALRQEFFDGRAGIDSASIPSLTTAAISTPSTAFGATPS